MSGPSVQQRLTALPELSKPRLCILWRQLFEKDPPSKIRRELIVRVLAYRLKELEFGGLGNAQSRHLLQLASDLQSNPKKALSTQRPMKPGTRLIREWKEQVHVVEASDKGFRYRGNLYESLSEIARLITGTRWSGPLFFGLKGDPSKKTRVMHNCR
jgi:hypothetical protein